MSDLSRVVARIFLLSAAEMPEKFVMSGCRGVIRTQAQSGCRFGASLSARRHRQRLGPADHVPLHEIDAPARPRIQHPLILDMLPLPPAIAAPRPFHHDPPPD